MTGHTQDFEPLLTLRSGNIEGTIWEADEGAASPYIVKIARVYWQDDEWKHSIFFQRDDLVDLASVTLQAYSWVKRLVPPVEKVSPRCAPELGI